VDPRRRRHGELRRPSSAPPATRSSSPPRPR
jgi:hypothetical protein